MHPEAEAFLDAIFDHPDDDTPRLVYSDWLQEHGQENYARFIRLQCAAAREKLWSDEANRLWEEIGRVWNRLDDEWWPATRDRWYIPGRTRLIASRWDPERGMFVDRFAPYPSLLDAIHFERGFLRPSIPATAAQLLYFDFHRCSFGPVSSFLIIFDNSALEAVADLPALRWVTRVGTSPSWAAWSGHEPSPDAMNEFLRSGHLRRVKVLDLSTYTLMQANIPILLSAPNLASVEELLVNFGDIPDCDSEETLPLLKGRFERVIVRE